MNFTFNIVSCYTIYVKIYRKGEAMLTDSQRQAIVDKGLSRKEKNKYTQSSKRTQVGSGYGDCSSTVRWCYQQVLGVDIGINTEAQIKSKKLEDVKVTIKNGIPDENKLMKADLLYFRGNDTSRTKGVGHVEMYIGDGKLLGHGSGTGPTEKNMKSYCKYMQSTKCNNGNRGLICVRRLSDDVKTSNTTTNTSKPVNNTTTVSLKEYYTVQKGDTLSKIARKFNTTVNKLVEMNNIKNKNLIIIGQKICVIDYSKVLSGYIGYSIVDAFKYKKLDSSMYNRKKYAEKVGIKNYKGTKEQNELLLKLLGAKQK